MEVDLMLGAILLFSIIGKANTVALASIILLAIRLTGLNQVIPPAVLEKTTLNWGLTLVTVAVMAPFVTGKASPQQAVVTARTWIGWVAFFVSLAMTWLSGQGVYYMVEQGHAELLPAMILGAAVAATFLKGVPVGPLIGSGVVYLISRMVGTAK